MDASSILEIIVVIAVGFAVVAWGVRSKWKYISQVNHSHVDDPWVHVSEPEIKVRVRRLAVLCIICLLGMAITLIIMLLSRSTIFSIASLIFAVIAAFTHILIDLDTSKR
jgi:hypothetical protein